MMALYRPAADQWADPLSALRRIQDEVNRTFGGYRFQEAIEFPPLNVWRGEQGVKVVAEVPGVKLDQMEISVHQNTLTIKGTREPEVKEADVAVHRSEREYGAFTRTVTLPFNVDPEQVKASVHNGILSIELPRPESDKPKRIAIKTS
jgi:HSP20 family protein